VSLEYRHGVAWISTRETASTDDSAEPAQLVPLGEQQYELRLGQRMQRLQILEDGEWLQIGWGLSQYRLRWRDPLRIEAIAPSAEASLAAPMPGRIIALLSSVGAQVARGTALLVMEAMKMEHTLCAPAAGTVRAYRARVGDQVQEGHVLVDFEAAQPRA
jgi:3-methylcrotonyl-CoA carboxylase alpha subunit